MLTRKSFVRVMVMLNKFWEVNFFFSNVLVPLFVLALYFISFTYLHSSVLSIPNGVNYVFANRSGGYLLILSVGNIFVFFILLILKRGEKFTIKNPNDNLSRGDFLLLLLPLTPVVQYIINNQNIMAPSGLFYVFIFFLLYSGIYIIVIPDFLGFAGSTRTLMILGLAFVFTITSMPLISQNYSWFEIGTLRTQLKFFGIIFLASWFLYNLKQKDVLRLIIAVFFITNTAAQLLTPDSQAEGESVPAAENKLLSLIGEKIPLSTPNIYLLVYDAYVTNETMLGYGIDNRAQEEYLSKQGFELYPHNYSVASKTLQTMSRVLEASADLEGNPRRGVSGDGLIQNILSDIGYETYGVFPYDYFFQGIGSTYDFSSPELGSAPGALTRAILIGEFQFDIGFNFNPQTNRQYLETKQSIFEGVSREPAFIYMQSNLPGHTQNSGACLPDETDRFAERLRRGNIEMKQDINTIIENDPEAIIIVAGDHGPYLTKNCTETAEEYDISEISRLDLQDRFGAFLAVKWPSEEYSKFDDITVSQDVFPAVFAYLFGDERILESKIEPETSFLRIMSWASVKNGIIYGGIHDGEPLFLSGK